MANMWREMTEEQATDFINGAPECIRENLTISYKMAKVDVNSDEFAELGIKKIDLMATDINDAHNSNDEMAKCDIVEQIEILAKDYGASFDNKAVQHALEVLRKAGAEHYAAETLKELGFTN